MKRPKLKDMTEVEEARFRLLQASNSKSGGAWPY
jgi:hypothetical protein